MFNINAKRLTVLTVTAFGTILLFQNATDSSAYTSTDFSKNEIADFLLPDICIDNNGVQTYQNPLNSNPNAPECARRRQILPGDFFPYFRSNFLRMSNKYYLPADPTYNPQSNRIFIFPLQSKYDSTDQNGERSTTILHWQTRPINDKGDQDKFASAHPFYDTMGALNIRNGYGNLLGNVAMPITTEDVAQQLNKRDVCKVEGKCLTRDDWMLDYSLSGGKGLYDFKRAKNSADHGYHNDGVALFEQAWSFPQRKDGNGYRAPKFGEVFYEVLPKRTQVLEVTENNEPVFSRIKASTPVAKSIGILANIGRFRFGPGDGYGKAPNKKMNNYMEALVHFGFAKTNRFNDAPGRPNSDDVDMSGRPYKNNPSVSERTYLTRELGYNTRWELWHGTNLTRKNWEDDERAAITAYEGQNCSIPANIAAGGEVMVIDAEDDNDQGRKLKGERVRRVTPHFAASNVEEVISQLANTTDHISKGKPFYAQYFYTLDAKGVWHRLRWTMVGCHDTTNLKTNYINNFINKGKVVFSSHEQVKVFPERATDTRPRCMFLNLLVRGNDQKRCD